MHLVQPLSARDRITLFSQIPPPNQSEKNGRDWSEMKISRAQRISTHW